MKAIEPGGPRIERIKRTVTHLVHYCKEHNWAGYDPYDALNSPVFNSSPFAKSRFCRIALTQALKRLPVNVRAILLVPQLQNPKALALFLTSFIKLSRMDLLQNDHLIDFMIERIVALRSPHSQHWCWGYSFPWQTRTVLVPQWAPSLVCTVFVANALLDVYERDRRPQCLDMAISAGEYILNELYWDDGERIAGFSYPLPGVRVQVHNANFLAAALLCRLFKHMGRKEFLNSALSVARWSAGEQLPDGAWHYGSSPTQRWVDNFHTGYNLCALRSIGQDAETAEFESHLTGGYEFYLRHFFLADGTPKYFHDRTFPIDVHCVAQSIITLSELRDLAIEHSDGLCQSVFEWAMTHMWDERRYFYYQLVPHFTNKISYMRWSQAWMLLALTTLLECSLNKEGESRQVNVQMGSGVCR